MRPLIVFDLDGTLVDSALDVAESANELLATYGAPPLRVQDVASMIGDGARLLVARALKRSQLTVDVREALDRFLGIYARRLAVHTRPYPGVPDAIAGVMPRASLAVLTNKPEHLSRRLLEACGFGHAFAWVIGGDGAFPRKPDPSGLLYLVREAGVPPGRCLMVGDSMVDVDTARAAGARVCLAAYGFGRLGRPIDRRDGDLIARRSEDLATALDEFLDLEP
jgi:phosphoglycolate phosphatase